MPVEALKVEEITLKLCKKCYTEKPRYEFHKQAKSKDGRHAWCKECKRKYDLERRKRSTKRRGPHVSTEDARRIHHMFNIENKTIEQIRRLFDCKWSKATIERYAFRNGNGKDEPSGVIMLSNAVVAERPAVVWEDGNGTVSIVYSQAELAERISKAFPLEA